MFNIVHFQQRILDEFSPAYKVFNSMYEQNLLSNPVIYTDAYDRILNNKIPIFSTFYIRESFSASKYILVDYQDYSSVPEYLQKNCIVIYNELFHNVELIESCLLKIELEENSIELIKEKLGNVNV